MHECHSFIPVRVSPDSAQPFSARTLLIPSWVCFSCVFVNIAKKNICLNHFFFEGGKGRVGEGI